MVLPTLSEVNAMNKPQLKDVVIEALNADAPTDLHAAIAVLINEVRKSQTETADLRQDILNLKAANEELQATTVSSVADLTAEITNLKTAMSSLKNEVLIPAATTSNEQTNSPPTFADVIRKTLESSAENEQCKHELIISKAEETGDDEKFMGDLCTKLDFMPKPREFTRIGKKISARHRLLKVSFPSHFDARKFKSSFEENNRNVSTDDAALPNLRIRFNRTKDEHATFKRNSDVAFKLNKEAETKKENFSFSVRDNGDLWKFQKEDSGKWRRVKEWSHVDAPTSGNLRGASES